MSRAQASPAEAILNSVHRFQSNVSVRAAEAAFVLLSLGGFYLIAILRLVDPYSQGVTYQVLNATPIAVQVALTVVLPAAVVVLEWLSALAQLRRQSGSEAWSLGRRVRFLTVVTSVDRSTAALIYMPLLPVAFFWAIVALLHQQPYWVLLAIIGVLDVVAILAVNKYVS